MRWFLSFDCATKSFAFSLVRVCLRPDGDVGARLKRCLRHVRAGDLASAEAVAAELDRDLAGGYYLAGGGAVDLAPGVPDSKIRTVDRVMRLTAYLRDVVGPTVAAAAERGCPPVGPDLDVAVEWQMGPNSKSRIIAHALLAVYASANVFFVGPALKNKLRFPSRPDLDHCLFVERYASTYTANKKHAIAVNTTFIAPLFRHPPLDIPRAMAGDFADSVLQILGILVHGDLDRAALMY